MAHIQTIREGLILKSLKDESPELQRRFVLFHGEDESHWSSTYLNGAHPTVTDNDIFVVVDSAHDDRVVSSLVLIPQPWRYESVDLVAARIELVKTDREYRERGLMRELIEAAHTHSADCGHGIQIIMGISGFYARFGYTQTVERGHSVDILTPRRQPTNDHALSLRPATPGDVDLLIAYDNHVSERYLLTVPRGPREWTWEIEGRPARKRLVSIIQTGDGLPIGYIVTRPDFSNVYARCLGPDASYLETFDDTVSEMIRLGHEAADRAEKDPPSRIVVQSPAPEIARLVELTSRITGPPNRWDWYIRANDLAALIRKLRPVLECRLKNSTAHRYSGDLTLDLAEGDGI